MYKMLIVKETVAINLKEIEWGLEGTGGRRHRKNWSEGTSKGLEWGKERGKIV